ncbi:PREDICTED: uncharacterized protein LOC105571260 isoform X2 [Vollenhovia emeryi]|uniref:uncharacterized protein LOC105571260 isoform X2 n=1 Tax=Vollenhovia emeryi TaxID=411798 RepID=UPI0005F4DB25|nr:PREDICTED: uncharacterized protein LOC105571260 isoform X2 [Vollenhovia emeryi]
MFVPARRSEKQYWEPWWKEIRNKSLVKSIVKSLGAAETELNVSRRTTRVVGTGVRTVNLLRGIIRGNPTRDLGSLDNSEYIMMLSRGGLMYPSEEFLKVANIMDDVFEKFHGPNQLKLKTKYIFRKVADLVMEKYDSIPRDALLCLVRTRTYIRLRKWNIQIREEDRFKKTAKK